MQDTHPMTVDEVVKTVMQTDAIYGALGGAQAETEKVLRSALRALLLHVGESLPEPFADMSKHVDYDAGVLDCKRVIDKMISEI